MKANRIGIGLAAVVLLSSLAACSGSESNVEYVALKPGDWPTAAPSAAAATRTPFPKLAEPIVAPAEQAAATPTTESQPAAATITASATVTAALPMSGTATVPTPATAATAVVKADALNVRKGPGAGYAIVGAVHRGDTVGVLAANPQSDWLLVKDGAIEGWVAAPYMEVPAGLKSLPQATPAALPTVAAAAAPAVVLATPPGSFPGRLAFQLSSGGDVMIADGGQAPRRLTNGMDPALSPDRQTVAFTRWQGDQGSLWVINVDGSGERQLVSGLRKAKGAEWSPDGQRIVFNYQHEGRLTSQWVCKPFSGKDASSYGIPWNATDIKVRVFGGTPYLCWTIPSDEHWALHVVSSSDGKGDDLYAGMYAFRPTWDPVRSWRLVNEAGDGLMETSVNADHTQKLTDKVEDHSPVFSPDGQYLAVTYDTGGRWDIFRLNADGSGRVRLTDMPLWTQVGPDKQQAWNSVSPAWSPDGSQIAFLTDRTGRWEIWVMNADGSGQRPLFSTAVNDGLKFTYDFVDEKVLSWR